MVEEEWRIASRPQYILIGQPVFLQVHGIVAYVPSVQRDIRVTGIVHFHPTTVVVRVVNRLVDVRHTDFREEN